MKTLQLAVIILMMPFAGVGAVGFDANATSNAHCTACSTVSLTTLTVGSGSNRALIGEVSMDNALDPTLSSFNWDSAGTPQALASISAANNGTDARARLYGLVNPTAGNKTLAFTLTTPVTEIFLNATSFTGVDQTGGTTSFPHSTSNTGTSTTASVVITSAVGNFTVDASTAPEAYSSPSKTQNYYDGSGSFTSGASSRAAGAASNTHSWTLGSSVTWASAGTDILASGGAAPTCLRTLTLLGAGC